MLEFSEKRWGSLPDGSSVRLFDLSAGPFSMQVSDYGCTIVSLNVPDRDGAAADIVLGYDTLAEYIAGHSYFGCVIGRCANRIAAGRFSLNGRVYELAKNNAPGGLPCHLHGGTTGFNRALWKAAPFRSKTAVGVRFFHRSKDGDEGYPGNLDVLVEYSLSKTGDLTIHYQAACDQPTVLNLTNHSYFNLCGHDRAPILDHELSIAADYFTPVNAGLIPTGELCRVGETPFDFRMPVPICSRIDSPDAQIAFGPGYDHNFAIRGKSGELRTAATVYEPTSGRMMEVLTTQPGLQFYSGNFLDGSQTGKGGCRYGRRSGFCLETQHFPDSPNQPAFPSVVLQPDESYTETTVYRFSAR